MKENFDVKSMEDTTSEGEAFTTEEKSGEETYMDRAGEKGKISASRKVDMRKHSAENAERIAHKNQPKESAFERSCRLKEEAAQKDRSKRNQKNVRTKVSDEE